MSKVHPALPLPLTITSKSSMSSSSALVQIACGFLGFLMKRKDLPERHKPYPLLIWAAAAPRPLPLPMSARILLAFCTSFEEERSKAKRRRKMLAALRWRLTCWQSGACSWRAVPKQLQGKCHARMNLQGVALARPRWIAPPNKRNHLHHRANVVGPQQISQSIFHEWTSETSGLFFKKWTGGSERFHLGSTIALSGHVVHARDLAPKSTMPKSLESWG